MHGVGSTMRDGSNVRCNDWLGVNLFCTSFP